MKRILITGKSSYLGNAAAEYLKRIPERFQIDQISLRDGTWRMKDLSVYDCVFHVAGIAHANTGKLTPEEEKRYYAVNTDLAIEVASAAKYAGVKQFIHMSSMIVYGSSNNGRIGPDTQPVPDTTYGDSKWKGERGVAALADERFAVAIIRAPMIYGPGCKGNYRVLSRLASTTPIFPWVSNERSMLYIENLCSFLLQLIERELAGVFFPQNSRYVNTAELVACIARTHHRTIHLLRWLSPVVTLMKRFPGKLGSLSQKAFGTQTYDLAMSRYEGIDYQLIDFEQSITLTETGK